MPCLPALPLLALGLTACFSTGGTPASTVIPKDPTPLAKCHVAKSSASPLVTEWPASEKAHLESLLSDRAVVVAYSGCEMRILDGCRLQGSYRFQKTTLARDTIEIRDADELYAKIPLGAVGLEGELARSGRLAVKTTVAGQMKLGGETPEAPDTAACREATHVISALSMGAFALVSGGEVSAGIKVDASVAGGGVKHESGESTLRSAGEPDACSRTKTDAASEDCNSPIQVFLVPIEHSAGGAVASSAARTSEGRTSEGRTSEGRPPKTHPSEGRTPEPTPEPERQPVEEPRPTPAATSKEPPADLSVEVAFEAPTPDERWELLESSGKVLCELPCTRRVGKNSGLKLQLDAAKKEDIVAVAVPDDLGYSAGRRVRAVPQAARNSVWASVVFYGGVLGVVAGLVIAAADKNGPTGGEQKACGQGDDGSLDNTCIAGIATMAAGGALTLIGGVWWIAYDRPEALDITLLDSGQARGQHEEPARRVGLGLGGIMGTF